MRSLTFLLAAALAGALVLAAASSREPFAARVVRLEAAAALPGMSERLARESLAVNAVLLEYASDAALRLNAHLALLRHPQLAREILPLYGLEPEFRDILARHGPAVLPPIAWFMADESRPLELLHAAGEALQGARRLVTGLWGARPAAGTPAPHGGPDAVTRGWYAVGMIRDQGHDLLGQFVLDEHGRVQRVQTERLAEAASSLFSGGIRTLETSLRRGREPDAWEYLWAGVDLAVVAGTVKLLRMGRVATGGAGRALPARTALPARAVLRATRTALRAGRYAVPLAVAAAVLRHPSLLSGLAAQAAALLRLPVWLVQGAVWFLVLLPALLALRALTRWLIRPAARLGFAAARGLRRLERATRRAAAGAGGGAP